MVRRDGQVAGQEFILAVAAATLIAWRSSTVNAQLRAETVEAGVLWSVRVQRGAGVQAWKALAVW